MNTTRIFSLLLLIAALVSMGCTVSEVITAESTDLDIASLDISENLLLDVGIMNFDAGVPAKNNSEKSGIYPEVRMAEARYIPYHMKKTLQGTGYWGAVRVIPNRYVFTDVTVTGRIERSDGEYVSLVVTVEDTLGVQWYEKQYSMQTGLTSFSEYRDRSNDPYQKVFNDIANDLRSYAAGLEPKEIARIRQASELKFFADMAPDAYSNYLTEEDGLTTVVRLPAENDPMVIRLRQIRERDRLVIDTLNEHYANFYYGIALPYEGWRKRGREQAIAVRQTKRSAALKVILGAVVVAGSMQIDPGYGSGYSRSKHAAQMVGIDRGMRTIYDAWNMRRDIQGHREDIKELSESFVAEAAPLVIQVEGESRRLTGTAEAQYESWRKLLHEIYQVETGFPETVDVSAPARTAEPTG